MEDGDASTVKALVAESRSLNVIHVLLLQTRQKLSALMDEGNKRERATKQLSTDLLAAW
jgi:hypothetical protein